MGGGCQIWIDFPSRTPKWASGNSPSRANWRKSVAWEVAFKLQFHMGNSSVSVQLLLPICLWTCFLDLFGFMEWGTKPSFFVFVETIFAPLPVDIFLWYPVPVLWRPLPFCVTRVVPFPFYLFFSQVETWNHPVLPRVKLYM